MKKILENLIPDNRTIAKATGKGATSLLINLMTEKVVIPQSTARTATSAFLVNVNRPRAYIMRTETPLDQVISRVENFLMAYKATFDKEQTLDKWLGIQATKSSFFEFNFDSKEHRFLILSKENSPGTCDVILCCRYMDPKVDPFKFYPKQATKRIRRIAQKIDHSPVLREVTVDNLEALVPIGNSRGDKDSDAIFRVAIPQQDSSEDLSDFRSRGEIAKNASKEIGSYEEKIAQNECNTCGEVIYDTVKFCPHCGVQQKRLPKPIEGTKSRTTATILAILLGSLGLHKFYLGRIVWGILYLLFCCTFIPAIVGFIEGIIYLTMSDESFAKKYG